MIAAHRQPATRRRGLGAAAPCAPLAAALLALLLACAVPCASAQPAAGGDILINEFLAAPANTSLASPATKKPSDWVELLNAGAAPASLGGWVLAAGKADSSKASRWQLPAVDVPPGGYLVLIGAGSDDAGPAGAVAAGPGGIKLLPIAGLKLGRKGDPLALLRPDGTAASTTGDVPAQQAGVTFGIPAGAPAGSPPTFLLAPTPGAPNTAAKPTGPVIHSTKRKPDGYTPPDVPITVTAHVEANSGDVAGAQLVWRVNYGPEQRTAMAAEPAAPGANATTAYSATIPAAAFKAGDMVRWAVVVTAANGLSARDPDPSINAGGYKGTVIAPEQANGTLPVLYWFAEDPVVAQSKAGGISSLALNGSFYDGVKGQRRGVTSLNYPKPKMKFKALAGKQFDLFPDAPKYSKLKLNSMYFELGEDAFMKEYIATRVMAEEGVVAPLAYHVAVYINGQFAGLYEVVEEVSSQLIQRAGLPKDGPIYKSISGELSNMRWDLPFSEMPHYYGKANRKHNAEDWVLLANLTRGLAGGGPVTRSRFLFDDIDLPAVVNEMAVQTLLNNMDRCTKNFYLWRNPETLLWRSIPWDLEASMGQDNGLGGAPGELYCILACEQWSSPLYCDSEHPQDLVVQTEWGATTVVGLNPYFGPARGSADPSAALAAAAAPPAAPAPPAASGRRRLRQAPDGRLLAEGNKPLTWPAPRGWDNPDRVSYGTPSVNGAAGTYNHLIDTILDINATRAMYMRRLRTLADKYYGPDPDKGRLRQIIDETWARIKAAAALDNQKWGRGDGSRGYAQLTTEFIPIRAKQLLKTYAPGGARPMLPGPQDDSDVRLSVSAAADAAVPEDQRYIQVTNKLPDVAVDMSRWTISKGDATWAFTPGTVIPGGASMYLSPNLPAFRTRPTSPKGGEGLLAVQAPAALLAAAAAGGQGGWTIKDAAGSEISQS